MPVRKVDGQDIPACVAVIRESFLTVAREFGITQENAPRFTAFAINEDRLRCQLGEERPMYAYVDQGGRVTGYYSLLVKKGGACELNNLCVLPDHRHGGIGGRLLEHAIGQARELGCGKMEIGIVEENEVLKDWYRRFGFVHVGTKKFEFFPFTCGYMERELA